VLPLRRIAYRTGIGTDPAGDLGGAQRPTRRGCRAWPPRTRPASSSCRSQSPTTRCCPAPFCASAYANRCGARRRHGPDGRVGIFDCRARAVTIPAADKSFVSQRVTAPPSGRSCPKF
jgi:hypothetical protein